jgi:hypothetical protein
MNIKNEEPILAYEVSDDEALESAAMVNGAAKNYTLTFCSTPWTCPMSLRANEAEWD